ncbi:DUF3078 domain-containing protein [Ohtaekwangia kribbensis]|jgi:hypothetical protein|uniref:DUF3078 domain-containing protein n=1 Tax=Ohtaekwangia kribbensis TaxID=688913 RepID=A0ABW3JZJ7_9BACT
MNEKKIKVVTVLVVLILFAHTHLQAQIVKPDTLSNWHKKFTFTLNFNQASFSSNWKAGGVNSVGFNSGLNYKAGYEKGHSKWDNEIDLLYGFVNNSGQGFRKTLDRLYLDTKYGYKLNDKWDIFTSLNFLSQFSKGYKYEDDATGNEQALIISDFLAPAFITSAWGAEYHPTTYFKLRLSPFAPRLTIVQDPTRFTKTVGPEPYGVDSTKTTRFEWLAFQMTAEFDKEIFTNVNLKWRYLMFANYETLELKTIDHRVDLMITAKVNRFINVSLGGILLYDYDQDSGAQYNQLFNFGFMYSFQNFEDKK